MLSGVPDPWAPEFPERAIEKAGVYSHFKKEKLRPQIFPPLQSLKAQSKLVADPALG